MAVLIPFVCDDGGRKAAGFRGDTGDCVTRAIAISTGLPYREVYDTINHLAKTHERRKRKSSAREGVFKPTTKRYLESLGWTWTPTMHIGQGCKVHLRPDELPSGRDSGRMLGEWLMRGNSVEPRFGNWHETITSCRCSSNDKEDQ